MHTRTKSLNSYLLPTFPLLQLENVSYKHRIEG